MTKRSVKNISSSTEAKTHAARPSVIDTGVAPGVSGFGAQSHDARDVRYEARDGDGKQHTCIGGHNRSSSYRQSAIHGPDTADHRCARLDRNLCMVDDVETADDRFEETQLEALSRKLQRHKMEQGVNRANRDWIEASFAEWNSNLDECVSCMTADHVAFLSVAMADMLAVRDALIVSLVVGGQTTVGTSAMLDMASNPHDPANVARMYRLLNRAFNDERCFPDRRRCVCGIDMLEAMASQVAGRFEVPPLTVAAYASWWLGSEKALGYAQRALDLDRGCTLARIICSAIAQDLGPAWLRQ